MFTNTLALFTLCLWAKERFETERILKVTNIFGNWKVERLISPAPHSGFIGWIIPVAVEPLATRKPGQAQEYHDRYGLMAISDPHPLRPRGRALFAWTEYVES